jgi:PKD repeat protein
VRLNKQPQADAGDDIASCLGADILFDGSRSRSENKEDVTYTWDFGDGTANVQGVRASHTYKKPGIYQATLSVNDSTSRKCSVSKDSVSVLVNTKPSISLKEVKSVCVGTSIDLEATLKDPNEMRKDLKYRWDFGDGNIAQDAGPKISHVYQKGGEYLVRVSVDDQLGTPCSTDTQSIKVKVNTVPVANAGPNLVCCADTESAFDGSGSYDPDGDNLTYIWDFGDGSTARGAKVTHVYKKIGRYKVVLTVDDNSGTPCSKATSSFEATVNEKPVSIIKVHEGKIEKKGEKKKR